MDYHTIDYIIRKNNYSLWCHSETNFDIIKNEHGTYGEYYDFVINVELNIERNISKYNIIIDNDILKKDILKFLDKLFETGKICFHDFCFAIAENL